MRFSKPVVFLTMSLMAAAPLARAEYTETMDPRGYTRNLKKDFKLKDDGAQSDQSAIFQEAIDQVASRGGGCLIVPKGMYRLAGINLRSNIHLLIDAGTVIKPYWPAGTKTVVFNMDAERPSKKGMTEKQEQAYIENVSIRGVGGPFVIDYSDRVYKKGEGVRGIITKMVRNFLIENMDVKDNYTTYCGITLTPMQTKYDSSKWEVSRSTDGTVRNCRIFNASPGYGLTQLHGAQSVHFENLYAEGGVTLRMETGAVGDKTAIYDITAKNITCENGRCAVMFGPHSAMNGVVKVDGVLAKSCTYAVQMGKGGVKAAELKKNPDAVDGIFAEGTSVKNIHAVFGMTAQVKTHALMEIPEEYYKDLNLRWFGKFFEAPSIGAVRDSTDGHYHVDIENVTMEGFKYNADKPILTDEDVRPGKWADALKQWKAATGFEG